MKNKNKTNKQSTYEREKQYIQWKLIHKQKGNGKENKKKIPV